MINDTLYKQYLASLLKGDRATCRSVVTDLTQTQIEIKDIYTHLFQRSLYEVGEMWETNKISVATEHLATAITDGLLSLVYPQIFAAEHTGNKAVITCTANEWHQIGGKMAADIFELNGWDGHFLGANTPMEDLLQYVQDVRPDVLGLSLSIYSNLPKLIETAQTLRTEFNDLDIFCGGQAFRWGGKDEVLRIPRTVLIPGLNELEKTICEKC